MSSDQHRRPGTTPRLASSAEMIAPTQQDPTGQSGAAGPSPSSVAEGWAELPLPAPAPQPLADDPLWFRRAVFYCWATGAGS